MLALLAVKHVLEAPSRSFPIFGVINAIKTKVARNIFYVTSLRCLSYPIIGPDDPPVPENSTTYHFQDNDCVFC